MPKLQRTSVLSALAFAVSGGAVGLLTQMVRSTGGTAPFVPPYSLAATLGVIAVVLVLLGVLLYRAVAKESGRGVDPFQAVRLLAAARAGIFAGSLFTGFGAGLVVPVLVRSVPAQSAIWAPMIWVLIAGVVLVIAGVITEYLCRVPPDDPEIEDAALG